MGKICNKGEGEFLNEQGMGKWTFESVNEFYEEMGNMGNGCMKV